MFRFPSPQVVDMHCSRWKEHAELQEYSRSLHKTEMCPKLRYIIFGSLLWSLQTLPFQQGVNHNVKNSDFSCQLNVAYLKTPRPSTQRGPSSLGSTSRFTCILPFNQCLTGYSVGISDSPNFDWTIYEKIPSFSIVPNIRIVPLDGSQSYHTISAFNQTVTQLFRPHRPRRLLGTWPTSVGSSWSCRSPRIWFCP